MGKTLPLEPVVNVIVNLSARSAVRKAFDLALLVGETSVIPQEERIRIYSSISEMLEDGFTLNDRLYKAAALIFGQAKTPQRVAIGCIGTVTEVTQVPDEDTEMNTPSQEEGSVAPEDSVEDEELEPTQEELGGAASPDSLQALSTATRRETPVETFAACRETNGEWYVGIYCADITNDEHLACAEYFESITPSSVYAYTTNDATTLTDTKGNIFAQLKAKNYRRSFGQYSSQHKDAVCAIIGWAMGAMTGTAGSAFTLAYKTEVGVETENATAVIASQAVDNVKANNGNIYINRGSSYDIFEEGTLADGTWFDELIFLDKYQNEMQLSIMDLLYQNNKIAQTEGGMSQIVDAVKEVCEDMRRIGFIESGVWKASSILNLQKGDTLPNGYYIQTEPIDEQSQADRDARKAPYTYVSLKLAGAIHHVTVQVDVNR